ncbi:glycosyltransferase family 4 protein [Flavobacterium sp. 245]|uniref:glycosyltransferase family 4 protein n=1 Tax=Flavobacterium sp. 245 TaxID=2512115 RepID=UPI00106164C2|nr:glycosyltransferase family 4 protein [Flavobacterium sp. 245]TDP02431.1 glycosyltransferase involved in cell wall biosynthesis [Flavobacterium sp. 245]
MLTKRRLLFINTLYSPNIGGGAEIILQEQIEGLKAKAYHVAVLVTGPDKGLKIDKVNDVTVYRAGLKNLYWHFTKKKHNKFLRLVWHFKDRYNNKMRTYVNDVIKMEKPDVIICHNLTGWSISVWDEIANAGIPIIQVIHDLYLLCPSSSMFRGGKACQMQCSDCRLFRANHVLKSENINAVIGVSNYILNRFLSAGYFAKAQKHVVYNAREIEDTKSKKERIDNKETLRIGYIGTLSEIKGVEWLINQFQSIDINATLIIAGRGLVEYERHLKEIATNENVSFIGYTSPSDFYSQVDIVVVPSILGEAFGLVAVEAGAYHLPVIASRIGGLPEIVKDGVNGLLCDVNDPDSLGLAILSLYNNLNLYNQLSNNSRASVESMLSKEVMLKEYEEIIKSV